MNRLNNTSDYWIGNLTGSSDMWWRDEEMSKGRDLVQLASYRSAISNYVNIVTGRTDIPVTYNSNDESYTDGKKVYLSGNMDSKNFDPNVGLALHEGSHIVHSDFELLRNLSRIVDERYGDEYGQVAAKIKSLINYIEDRRIDFQVFKSAPGYQITITQCTINTSISKLSTKLLNLMSTVKLSGKAMSSVLLILQIKILTLMLYLVLEKFTEQSILKTSQDLSLLQM